MGTTSFGVVSAQNGKDVQLAMESLWLTGKVLAVGARLVVCHTFRSKEQKPLELVYAFGLPRDAALRRFLVRGEGFRARSELKPVDEAVKAYEAGIEAGRLSTLARQYRDGVVNLSLGNVRPGETVQVLLEVLAGVETRDDGIRFRFPFTLAPCYHPQARALEIAPGVGEIELPDDGFGDVLLPQYLAQANGLHQVGFELSLALPSALAEVASPSHALRVQNDQVERCRVLLAPAGDVPNRDLVLDVRAKGRLSGVLGGLGKQGEGHFACVIPSDTFGPPSRSAKQVVFVLDRSGSMGGEPISRAKNAIEACLSALSAEDRFALVAFDDQVEVFKNELVAADRIQRDAARNFLEGIDARGGTELGSAITAAVRLLGDKAGDLFVVTDGQVSATEDILQTARSAEVRMHCLGIGSASQDRFLALLARETGATSRFVTPRERVDMTAVELFANVSQPVARDVKVTVQPNNGQVLPEPSATIFSGNPLVVFGQFDGSGKAELVIEWRNEEGVRRTELPIQLKPDSCAQVVRLLRGARQITDLESRWVEKSAPKRESIRIERRLTALSEEYGLASRKMALVAVVERADDRAGQIPKTTVVPVGMPEDVRFGSYFRTGLLRARVAADAACGPMLATINDCEQASLMDTKYLGRRLFAGLRSPAARQSPEDILLNLASRLEPDGGMPGPDGPERILRTLVALLCFLSQGNTSTTGTFRIHVQKLVAFLESPDVGRLPEERAAVVAQVVPLARTGKVPPGDWLQVWCQLLSGWIPEQVWMHIATTCAEVQDAR